MADPIGERLEHVLARAEGLTAADPAAALRRRLDAEPDDRLAAIVRDPTAGIADRVAALELAVGRRPLEPETAALLLERLDDPAEPVALAAIRLAPPFVAALRDRLRDRLSDPRPAQSHAAALALARRKDRAILPTLLDWLGPRHDPDRRQAAVAALTWLLDPPEALARLGAAWDAVEAERPTHDAGHAGFRFALAEALVERGDDRPLEFLAGVALDGGPEAARALSLIEWFDARDEG